MAALLDLLKKGSVLTEYDGKTPTRYDGNSNYEKDLAQSQLDLNGKTPPKYDGITNTPKILSQSQLDLDGKTPSKYLDNLPR